MKLTEISRGSSISTVLTKVLRGDKEIAGMVTVKPHAITTKPTSLVDDLLDDVFAYIDGMRSNWAYIVIMDDSRMLYGVIQRFQNGLVFYVPSEYDVCGGSPSIEVKEMIARWVYEMREHIRYQGTISWKRGNRTPTMSVTREQRDRKKISLTGGI
jgi:hypothetical protein